MGTRMRRFRACWKIRKAVGHGGTVTEEEEVAPMRSSTWTAYPRSGEWDRMGDNEDSCGGSTRVSWRAPGP